MLNLDRTELIEDIKIRLKKNGKELDKFVKLMDDVMDEMPSASLRGAPPKEFLSFENNTFEKMKNSDMAKEYKYAIKKSGIVDEKCVNYAYERNLQFKFNKVLFMNNIDIDDIKFNHSLILFHQIDKEDSIFDMCFKDITILDRNYGVFSRTKNSYVESLFQIKKFDPKNMSTILVDMYTNKEYKATDIGFSCSPNVFLNGYVYTTLVTIDGYTIIRDYLFIFYANHKDIKNEIEVKMKTLKGIKNERTKRYIASYLLSKKEKVKLESKSLN